MRRSGNILVTGGAGYIGSHACKSLAANGYTPVTLDNLVHGHRSAVRWGPLEVEDLANRQAIERIIRHYNISAIMHFAAYAYVGESMSEPGKYFRNNVSNTLTLIEAMRATLVEKIVFSSTCATYGIPDVVPIDESQPQQPVNPYGESKLFLERALYWNGIAHDLRSVTLRYFNAAGADLDGEIGEAHDPETHLLPLAIESAISNGPTLQIMGTDYPTPDGTTIRDYVHVVDLANAHVRALNYLQDGGRSCALNLGTGVGHSVRDVIAMVEHVSGQKVNAQIAERRVGDPAWLVAAPGLAHERLGWRAELSSLETIVRSAYQWHVSRLDSKQDFHDSIPADLLDAKSNLDNARPVT